LCGVAYGLLTANTPAPLFNTVFLLILSCIAGVLIGFTGRYLALHGGVKYLLLGLIAGLSFCYARWVTWSVVVFYEATLDPGQILWLLSVVMDYVVHQPEFYSVDEALVWGIWLTEALSATCVISLAAWVYGLSEYEYRRAVGNCQCSSDMVPSVFGQGGPLTGMTVGKLQTIETVDATGQ
jgi:hypothetical protein